MRRDEFQIALDELEDLLDAERTAVLSGNIDDVGRLFDQKSRLLEQLGGWDATNAEVSTALRIKLERNQNLLESAADGVRSVARRLSAVRRVRESLDTYDARGQRTSVNLKSCGALEKRA
ncbi:flagellar biosynthesis protein FlgN [uncultured Tateyamaria sp.]|uniref:flagellar biosynthesis protein FlgN n=1 Tax=uncultured Tateyamaria sp. TaxID=455651 RepID=UPI002635E2DE|nr:flagellar biosynthesis protein FlgN [uncultured Tateyamaria sp.]